jgi:hypothetical protein
MLVIHHQGRPAAYVAAGTARLAANIAALEEDHPTRRWVNCLVVFARDVAEDLLPVPFTAPAAEYFARCVLMPDEEFIANVDDEDAELAELFNVPLDQIWHKRRDLVLTHGPLFEHQ